MVGSETVPASARDRAAALVGRVVSERYRIDEVLAMGGMGAVYRGEHIRMRKRVAIKVLHPETENLPELVARFEREAIAGAHIAHPNVASATDFGRLEDGSYYLVLEYVRGTTLSDLIQLGPLPPARATHIARQIAEALDAAHRMGVVHRDVKPRNVMIVRTEEQRDRVKLIDFGLAKVPLDRFSTSGAGHDDDQWTGTITATGIVFGTVAYMSPETGLGMEAVDARSDLYALGIILYEMLTGVHPFDAIEPGALFLQQRTQKPPPMRVRAPNVVVPPALERVVMRLLEKAPTSRFADARALVDALDAAAAEARLDLDAPVPALASDLISIAGVIPISIPPPPRLAPPDAARPPPSPPPISPPPPSPGYVPKLTPRAKPSKRRRSGRAWLRFFARTVTLLALIAVGVLAWRLLGDRDLISALPPLPALPSPGPPEVARSGIAGVIPDPPPEAPPELDEVAELRTRIVEAAEARQWSRGADAIAALARVKPAALREKEITSATIFILVNAAFEGGPAADRGFDALARRAGPDGVDVLYELYSTRGGSRAAARAAELLRAQDVVRHASAPLRVAIALRDAPCKEKPALFQRAADEGDVRALAVLEILRSPQCRPKIGQCCFKKDAAIEKAVIALRARLRKE